MKDYKFEYDKSLHGYYCWEVRWGYIGLVEWIEEYHPFIKFQY